MSTRLSLEEREQQILENMKLVYYLIQQLPHVNPNNYDDLVQIGRIGLIKAVSTFDPDKGIKFSTYAGKCINNEIYMEFRKERSDNRNTSLNEVLSTNEKGNEIKLGDILGTQEDLEDEIYDNDLIMKALNIILNLLNPNEAIILLYKISGLQTTKESGRLIGVSQSYASRIDKSAVRKLRQYIFTEKKLYYSLFSIIKEGHFYKFRCDDTQFNCALAKFLQKKQNSNLLKYKFIENDGRIELIMPSEPETFAFIAEFLKDAYGFISK